MPHDPGGKVRRDLQCGTVGSAQFTGKNNEYRPWLSRHIEGSEGASYALFIGMNPSTAGEDIDDPTVSKEWSFTQSWHFNRYIKCNVMDYRATLPSTLNNPLIIPRSPENLRVIKEQSIGASLIIVCWGNLHKSFQRYAADVLETLKDSELWCFGLNKDGSPKHPLYLSFQSVLQRFN